jgi:hypothetical protein
MPDSTIWDLTALTDPILADLLAVVDDPSGTPMTKKLALTHFAALTVSSVVVQVKTVGSGTYTPSAGMRKVLIIAVGGGGSGAGGINTDSAGGGGGGGGTVIELMDASFLEGPTGSYVVGAGGTAGGAGGSTLLTNFSGGGLISALGGSAGTAGATFSVVGVQVAGGAGGTSSGLGTGLFISGKAGERGVIFSATAGYGGAGGRSAFGFGGASGGTNVAGAVGQAYGGGGSGGHAAASQDRAGADGADGILYLIEFIG